MPEKSYEVQVPYSKVGALCQRLSSAPTLSYAVQ